MSTEKTLKKLAIRTELLIRKKHFYKKCSIEDIQEVIDQLNSIIQFCKHRKGFGFLVRIIEQDQIIINDILKQKIDFP